MAEVTALSDANPDPLGSKDLEGRGERLVLSERDWVEVVPGDLDTEGDWLTDPLWEGERELRRLGDMVSSSVPGEDGEEDRETALLPLGRGLLDVERETFAEGERDGLGDTVKVPLLEALGLGERLTVTLGRGEVEEDTVALLDRESKGLLEAEELADTEGGMVADLTPEDEPLMEAVDTTDTEADIVWEEVGEGEGAPEPVALDTVGFGVPVDCTDAVTPGVEVPVVRGETVAKEAVGAPDVVGMGEDDAECVVVVDCEAVVEVKGDTLPIPLVEDDAEAHADGVVPPDKDPVSEAMGEGEFVRDARELWEALGETREVMEGAGEREVERVPVASPVEVLLPLPTPLHVAFIEGVEVKEPKAVPVATMVPVPTPVPLGQEVLEEVPLTLEVGVEVWVTLAVGGAVGEEGGARVKEGTMVSDTEMEVVARREADCARELDSSEVKEGEGVTDWVEFTVSVGPPAVA